MGSLLVQSEILTVFVGMHALGWSREDAVNYMLAHTAASPENIRGEVCSKI